MWVGENKKNIGNIIIFLIIKLEHLRVICGEEDYVIWNNSDLDIFCC